MRYNCRESAASALSHSHCQKHSTTSMNVVPSRSLNLSATQVSDSDSNQEVDRETVSWLAVKAFLGCKTQFFEQVSGLNLLFWRETAHGQMDGLYMFGE